MWDLIITYNSDYASPSSGEACRDRQLTTNFELRVEIFCVADMFLFDYKTEDSLSVPREKKSPWLRQYSPTLAIDTYINGKVFTSTTAWKPKKFEFFQKKMRNCRNRILSIPREKKSPWLCRHQSYISNWYINLKVFTSRYYSMETKKFEFLFFQKVWNWILTCAEELKSTFK